MKLSCGGVGPGALQRQGQFRVFGPGTRPSGAFCRRDACRQAPAAGPAVTA